MPLNELLGRDVPGQPVPHDVARWVKAYVPRLDLTVDIAGYGDGAVSVLLVP